MGIYAENNGGDFEQLDPGSYIAKAYKMVDIGTQKVKDFATDDIVLAHQVVIYWEVLEDTDLEGDQQIRMKDNRPFSVQKTYKLSMHPKAKLRMHLDAWRGMAFTDEESKRFDITKLLGTYCRLSMVKSNDGKYLNVDSVGFTKRKPEGFNPLTWWSAIDPDRDMAVFEKLPDWLKTKIDSCVEWEHKAPEKAPEEATDHTTDNVAIKDVSGLDLSEIPF